MKYALLMNLVLAPWVYAQTPTTQITVFNRGPVSVPNIPNTTIRVINVREGDDINEQAPHFSFNPNDPDGQAKAEQQVKEWAQSPQGLAHRARLRQAWRSIETLYNCGIEKVPAVAFEGCRYVVYGTSDVLKAVQDYDDFRKTLGKTAQ